MLRYIAFFAAYALLDYMLFGWGAVGMHISRLVAAAQGALRSNAILPRKP